MTDSLAGTTVDPGELVSPAGLPGTTGTPGTPGERGEEGLPGPASWSTTRGAFNIPEVDAPVNISVDDPTGWMVPGAFVFVGGMTAQIISVNGNVIRVERKSPISLEERIAAIEAILEERGQVIYGPLATQGNLNGWTRIPGTLVTIPPGTWNISANAYCNGNGNDFLVMLTTNDIGVSGGWVPRDGAFRASNPSVVNWVIHTERNVTLAESKDYVLDCYAATTLDSVSGAITAIRLR